MHSYEIFGKREHGWEPMEVERFENPEPNGSKTEICNPTPLTLAPHSGVEAPVQGLTKGPRPYEMDVKVVAEDIFGKKYEVEVKAKS